MKSSPARILEEILRMLESGAAAPFFRLMSQNGLLEHLFPCLTHFLETSKGEIVYQYLQCADTINQNSGKNTLERSLLTTCLLFPLLEQELQMQYINKGHSPHIGEVMLVASSLIKAFVTSSFSHFPRRISATMNFILSMQYRLTPFNGKKHPRSKMFKNKEFILALKFLKIRALVDETHMGSYIYWKEQLRQHERHGAKSGHSHHHHRPKNHHAGN